ncbi:MAG TPA: hypothetical protein VFR86_16390 [Burkholderiaceae bacterium]|nr:hypothetical protein [Burkholderiaceae bacterium]
MTAMIPAGPYRTLTTVEGDSFPYYIIPFDADGTCEGPLTQQHLLDNVGGFTDIFLFSHGWNNDWTAATRRYESFIRGFQDLRRQFALKMPPGYKPLLVGIFWPSQAMEWFDSETGPGFAAGDPTAQDAAVDTSQKLLREIGAALPAASRERFFALAQATILNADEARELAQMLAGLAAPDDEGVRAEAPSAEDLLAAAASLTETEPDFDAVGTVREEGGGPQAAFGIGDVLRALDPRNLVKPFTVWQMKDRAGKVGARGVAKLLEGLLARSTARVHVVGHSYGCKVVMTATCALPEGTRRLHSALLLQPAVSQYAFAPEVPGRPGVAGGFFKGLTRVTAPIVATFSANDVALTKMFHLALRRQQDLGEEPMIAGESPSRYAALGGYGPQASDADIVDIRDPKQPYDWSGGRRLIGIRATRAISGHGDISNAATWWLAYAIAAAPFE